MPVLTVLSLFISLEIDFFHATASSMKYIVIKLSNFITCFCITVKNKLVVSDAFYLTNILLLETTKHVVISTSFLVVLTK